MSSTELTLLEANQLRYFRHAGISRLTRIEDRSWCKASPARAFPVSDPHHYIAFLDGDGKDIGLLVDPSGLDSESKSLLDEELELRYFVPRVTRIVSVKEEFGSVYWTAETTRGRMELVVRNLKDNVFDLPDGRTMVTDVDGNRVEFPPADELDAESRGILLRGT